MWSGSRAGQLALAVQSIADLPSRGQLLVPADRLGVLKSGFQLAQRRFRASRKHLRPGERHPVARIVGRLCNQLLLLLAVGLHLGFESVELEIGWFSAYMILLASVFFLPQRWLRLAAGVPALWLFRWD